MAHQGNKFILEKFIFNNQLPKAQNGVETWNKQLALVAKEKASKVNLKKLLENRPVYRAKTFEEKLQEKLQEDKFKTIAKDNTGVRITNKPENFSVVARNKTDKEIADERKAIREKSDANVLNQYSTELFNTDNWTRQNLADSALGLESKFRVSDEPNFFDDYLNPANLIANMASNLGQAPLQAQQSNSYLPYVTSIGTPLTVGAIAGLGAPSTTQFVNNLVNPIAGLEETIGNFAKSNFNKLKQIGKKTFTPTREIDLSNIERLSQDLRQSTGVNIESARRAYHNQTRYLTPEEFKALQVNGRGSAEDYMLPPPPGEESLQAGLTGTYPDSPTSFNFTAQEATDRLNAGMPLQPEHVERLAYENSNNNLSLADTELFRRYVANNRNAGRSTLMGGRSVPSLNDPTWGTGNWDYNNSIRNVIDINDPNFGVYTPRARNMSGHTKDDLINMNNINQSQKDIVLNMSDEEFNKTVTKPSGDLGTYAHTNNISQISNVPGHGKLVQDAIPMNQEEYVNTFNQNIDRLNEIIAKNNTSGVTYQVDRLHPNGQLVFSTPEQIIKVPNMNRNAFKIEDVSNQFGEPAFSVKYPDPQDPNTLTYDLFKTEKEAKAFTDKLNANQPTHIDSKIDAGTTSWSTDINPAKWKGQVEDIANDEYFRSIPGLNMTSTGQSVFADRMARQGSGAYRSINEFLKELELGRVKPGFNVQTPYSRGAWEKFIQKGDAVGHYGNPSTVYGSMKKEGGSDIPQRRDAVMSDFEKFQLDYINQHKNHIKSLVDRQNLSQEEATKIYNNILDEIERQRNETVPHDLVQFPLQVRNTFGNYEKPKEELGGLLYANVDAGLPHEQSMAKYLGPGKSVLEFMQRKKVVGGPVPFGEYYRENIINPRNKL